MHTQPSRLPHLGTAALLACLVCPLVAGAAQFAPSNLFLSKSAVVEGDTVLIHAVVQNDASGKFPGNVVFRDGDTQVGSVPVTLSAQEVRAVSVSWTPASPGSHTIVAALLDAGGTAVQSEEQAFDVAAKPKPKPAAATTSSQTAAAVESSKDIQGKINDLSPAAGGALAPVFRLVDGARSSIADVLDSQLSKTQPKLAPIPGVVAGTSTSIQTPEQASWFSSIFNTVYYYILTVLRWLIGSAAVFYPVLAFIFLYTLYRMFKRFRRD